jgi:PAS domain S-box-containing protein
MPDDRPATPPPPRAPAETVLETLPLGVLMVDRAGRIVWANTRAEALFGYGRGTLSGLPLEALLPERFRAGHVEHRAGFFAEPRVRPMGLGLDLAALRRDGSEFPVEISLSFTTGADGPLALAFVMDITARKEAEHRQRQVEQELARQRDLLYQTDKLAALGRLVAGVAHEMNNPLGIISSRIELMLTELEGQPLPPQHREDLQVVHRNVLRVAGVARALRSFARQSTGERHSVNLNTVVGETLLLVGKAAGADNVRITTALDPALPPMLGDANALQQVLLNLLTNAREAMVLAGGEVRIETGPAPGRPGWLRLAVSDTGPGIRPADLPHLFEPFYTTKPAGTGLGLAVSYGIVQDHQGTIEALSPPGQGATFVLTFPSAPPA